MIIIKNLKETDKETLMAESNPKLFSFFSEICIMRGCGVEFIFMFNIIGLCCILDVFTSWASYNL